MVFAILLCFRLRMLKYIIYDIYIYKYAFFKHVFIILLNNVFGFVFENSSSNNL